MDHYSQTHKLYSNNILASVGIAHRNVVKVSTDISNNDPISSRTRPFYQATCRTTAQELPIGPEKETSWTEQVYVDFQSFISNLHPSMIAV